MAGAGESASAGRDPYASDKANLRDTIKWLAGIFGALAAAVIAGTPLSGLGALSLQDERFRWAGLALLSTFICISLALIVTLRLLRSDLLYLSDINPSAPTSAKKGTRELQGLRRDLSEHRLDLFPEYESLQELFDTLKKAEKSADELEEEWNELQIAIPTDDPGVEAAKKRYDQQIAAIQQFRDLQQELLAYASYQRFYGRLRRAAPLLFGLGIGALVCLMLFTVTVRGPKEEKAPEVVVIPITALPAGPPASSAASQIDAGTVYFARGSAKIDTKGLASIEQARDALLKAPNTALLLMARTDTVGGAKINDSLARQRAVAVRTRLVTGGGIAPSRVFLAELPKSDLPKVTGDQADVQANRIVSMHMLEFRR